MTPAAARVLAAGAAGAVVAAALIYGGVWDAGFAFDDAVAVQSNPLVTGELEAAEAFTRDFWGDRAGYEQIASWRPLTVLSLRADHAVDGGRAWPFHGTNLALHILVVLSVLLLAAALALPPPVAVGLGNVVAVHPVFAEAVASVVGRGDLLATLFGVLGLAGWLLHPLVGLLSLALALAAKESAIVFVGAAMLLAGRDPRGRRWLPALVLLGVAWYVVRSSIVGHLGGSVGPMDNPLVAMGLADRAASALGVVGHYLWWWVVPQEIAADHAAAVDLTGAGGYTAAGVVLGLVLALAALRALRTLSWPGLLGAAIAGASLLLLSNLLFLLPTPLGGRLAYMPGLGLGLLTAAVLVPVFTDGSLALRLGVLALGSAWLLAGVPSTLGMVANWQSDRALFEASVELEPGSARSWANLGRQQLEAGDLDDALTSTRAALERVPEHPIALLNLALVLEAQGHKAEAWQAAIHAAQREPRPGKATANLCALGLSRSQLAPGDLVEVCSRAARALPGAVEPVVNGARALARAGRTDEAEAAFAAALTRFPADAFARGHYVTFLVALGRLDEAIGVQRAVLAAAPQDRAARKNLVALLFMLAQAQAGGGDVQRACETARSAAALAPGVAPVEQRAAALCGFGSESR